MCYVAVTRFTEWNVGFSTKSGFGTLPPLKVCQETGNSSKLTTESAGPDAGTDASALSAR
jgi:hypothetical protein